MAEGESAPAYNLNFPLDTDSWTLSSRRMHPTADARFRFRATPQRCPAGLNRRLQRFKFILPMKTTLFLRALALVITVAFAALHAQVPQLINYQGRVAVGNPPVNFDGTGAFKFALVNADGTTSYWSNDGTSSAGSQPTGTVTLTVTKGLYSVILGDSTLGASMTAIPNSVFANPDVRLRVWFHDGTANGFQHLIPDQRIAAVGYAMVAGSLQPGTDISAGTVTATAFSGDGSGLTNIPASAILPAVAPVPPSGMVPIPAGVFLMGDSSSDLLLDAVIVNATISAFYMDATEVTKAQWDAVKTWGSTNGYTDLPAGAGKASDHPVQAVNWYDVVKWCNARSEQAGKIPVYYTDDAQTTIYRTGSVNVTNAQAKWTANGYRLPTEAEWEKAARGGMVGQRFPWGNSISQNVANYFGSVGSGIYSYDQGPDGYNAIGDVGGRFPASSPVGSFPANGYGLHDMVGNVTEWCWDWYPSGSAAYAGGHNPKGATAGTNRVSRGGNCDSFAKLTSCAFRYKYAPSFLYYLIGFRTVIAPSS